MKFNRWRLWKRIRHLRTDADLEEELRIHLEMHSEDNLAAGMSHPEAQRRARLQLGRTRSILESIRDQDLITNLESWYSDLLFSLRTLREDPAVLPHVDSHHRLGNRRQHCGVLRSLWTSSPQSARPQARSARKNRSG
jgi:hypothetical protein